MDKNTGRGIKSASLPLSRPAPNMWTKRNSSSGQFPRSRIQCTAPSPALTIGDFYFRGGGCQRGRWHTGLHRNADGTSWGRWLQARMRLNRAITGSAYP